MKIARFSHNDGIRYGILDESEIVVLDGDPMFAGYQPTGERVPVADVALLAPVIPRSKVVCVGRNYHDHAAEFGNVAPEEPLLFLKPNTAVIGPGDSIVRPAISALTFLAMRPMTARDLQRKDGQWTRGKGFDTFCPLGPIIETEFDPSTARLETRVNGEIRQQAPLTDMIHSVADIIAYASAAFTLLPGDVIMTGTPAGVGEVVAGDTIEIEIDGIGVLRNPVRDAVPAA